MMVVPTYVPATHFGGRVASLHALARALAARGSAVDVLTTNV